MRLQQLLVFFIIPFATQIGIVKNEEIQCPSTSRKSLNFHRISMRWNTSSSTAELCLACIANILITQPVNIHLQKVIVICFL